MNVIRQTPWLTEVERGCNGSDTNESLIWNRSSKVPVVNAPLPSTSKEKSQKQNSLPHQENLPQPVVSEANKEQSLSGNPNSDSGFIQQRHQRKRYKKTLGTAESTKEGFSGEDKKVWLYVYRVKQHVTEDMIMKYIKGKEKFENEAVGVKEIPSDPGRLKRFAVHASLEFKDLMYDISFWPRGEKKDNINICAQQSSVINNDDSTRKLTRLLHLNTDSIKSKSLMVNVLLQEYNVNIFCLTEHWCNVDQISKIHFDGYTLANSYCRKKFIGGGTAIFVKNIKFEIMSSPVIQEEKIFEYSCINCYSNNLKLVVICVYRSPKSNIDCFLEKMTELLDFIFEHPRSVVVCGDINVDFLVETAQMLTVRQFFLSYGLDSRVTEITRPNPRGGSLLDNIFTNISEDISQATSLSSESWEQVYLTEDVNNKYKSFYNILFHHFDVAFPLTSKVTRAKSSENSWVNQEIKCYSQYVRNWYRLYTETKCDDILEDIKWKDQPISDGYLTLKNR
ncbi:hypothetical protein JTB14_035335 [Gonioctena quinquepunctata]|nr:hypothetical protein JTB14_035335 [Gonioctena quinquepunctata]